MRDKDLQDKQLQEQSEKVASKDDFPIIGLTEFPYF